MRRLSFSWLLLGLLVILVATVAMRSPQSENPPVRIATADGRLVEGSITGGTLTIETAFGMRQIEAVRLRALSPAGMTLDRGSLFAGTVTVRGGEIQLDTARGPVTIAGTAIRSVQGSNAYFVPVGAEPGASSGPVDGNPETLVLGQWEDGNSQTWEFFKDGTVLIRRLSAGYTFPDQRHIKILINGMVGVGMVPGGAAVPGLDMLSGTQLARVYEIVELSRNRMVWREQGTETVLKRLH